LTGRRLLIVNADDFGFTRDVNQGILEAHLRGIVTAATLMATGRAFAHALELARRHPTLDVGCHLTLIGAASALAPFGPLPASPLELAWRLAAGRLDVAAELRAQVRKALDAGLRPTHLDTHKHAHMLPQVASAVAAVSREFGIPWVRRPLDFALAGPLIASIYRRAGCRMTDHFAGYRLTGKLDSRAVVSLVAELRPGVTELMCHPGFCGGELRASSSRLKESRQRELEALTAPEVRAAVAAAGVTLTSYRSLA
jgi:predicted glycoside hydrolase/deacetylase ChbG (UPF0249 family)